MNLVARPLACLFLGAVVGCKSHLPLTSSSAPAAPTAEDRSLALRFDTLRQRLPASRIQEVLNLFNETDPAALRWSGLATNNTGPMALARLKGELPATEAQLLQARTTFRDVLVKKLDEIATNPPPPAISVARATQPVVVDGKLNEPQWQTVPEIPIAWCFRPWKARTGPPSTVRLLWTPEALYAAFNIIDRDIAAEPFVRDDDTFLWDAAEVFLVGDLRLGLYWEVCCTPSGGIVDRWFYKYPSNWFGHFTASRNIEGLRRGIQLRGTLNQQNDTDEGYTIEIAIPFAEVPGVHAPAGAGTVLHGLFALADRTGEALVSNVEYYSHTYSPVGFQDIWSFSPLTLEDAPAGK